MEIRTTYEIAQLFDEEPVWDDVKDNVQWVRVKDVLNHLRTPKRTKKHIIDLLMR